MTSGNVVRMIKALMGRPAVVEKVLKMLWKSLDENSQALVRREVYAKFFATYLAGAGHDYFKQSTIRLHSIADGIVAMTLVARTCRLGSARRSMPSPSQSGWARLLQAVYQLVALHC